MVSCAHQAADTTPTVIFQTFLSYRLTRKYFQIFLSYRLTRKIKTNWLNHIQSTLLNPTGSWALWWAVVVVTPKQSPQSSLTERVQLPHTIHDCVAIGHLFIPTLLYCQFLFLFSLNFFLYPNQRAAKVSWQKHCDLVNTLWQQQRAWGWTPLLRKLAWLDKLKTYWEG